MNIFFLDSEPLKIAQYHCDKHVVKMILETAQLLCTAHWETGSVAPYKSTHRNHPCSLWVRKSISNYKFLVEIGLSLCEEYSFRYDKKHKTSDVIDWCHSNLPKINDIGVTLPPRAMPEIYKKGNVIESYRSYYIGEKKNFAKWTRREVPFWFTERLEK